VGGERQGSAMIDAHAHVLTSQPHLGCSLLLPLPRQLLILPAKQQNNLALGIARGAQNRAA